ncbi:MAG: hypothetical protein GX242_02490 [Clostridiales bacterium]|nr:hypothetical protein [Clostridiales bacterium]
MIGVIDIGSNSVRLLLNGVKYSKVTKLSYQLFETGMLKDEPMQKTLDAVISYHNFAKNLGARKVFVFATEALRRAKNSDKFCQMLQKENITVDIISAETESKIAFLGAYTGGIQAVLDIGGASSELVVGDYENIFYSHSLRYGSVKLFNCFDSFDKAKAQLKKAVNEYGKVAKFDELIAIGGTAQSLATVFLQFDYANVSAVHNFVFNYDDIKNTVEMIINTPTKDRINIVGMHPDKTKTLPFGGLLMLSVMDYLNAKYARISYKDNLEGYLALQGIKKA